jgi:hypothetical protein
VAKVVIVDEELRDEIARAIHERAIQFPNSIAADVRPEFFAEVVDGVAQIIDLSHGFDTGLWAALGKWKAARNSHQFLYRPSRSVQWSAF